MNDLDQARRDAHKALDILEKQVERTSRAVELLRNRKSNLMAIQSPDPVAINLVTYLLADAEKELEEHQKSTEELRNSIARDEAA